METHSDSARRRAWRRAPPLALALSIAACVRHAPPDAALPASLARPDDAVTLRVTADGCFLVANGGERAIVAAATGGAHLTAVVERRGREGAWLPFLDLPLSTSRPADAVAYSIPGRRPAPPRALACTSEPTFHGRGAATQPGRYRVSVSYAFDGDPTPRRVTRVFDVEGLSERESSELLAIVERDLRDPGRRADPQALHAIVATGSPRAVAALAEASGGDETEQLHLAQALVIHRDGLAMVTPWLADGTSSRWVAAATYLSPESVGPSVRAQVGARVALRLASPAPMYEGLFAWLPIDSATEAAYVQRLRNEPDDGAAFALAILAHPGYSFEASARAASDALRARARRVRRGLVRDALLQRAEEIDPRAKAGHWVYQHRELMPAPPSPLPSGDVPPGALRFLLGAPLRFVEGALVRDLHARGETAR